MITTANARLADEAEFERSATMRAMQFEQADLARAVAESDEILAHDPQLQREVPKVVGIADRLPEAAQIFPARRFRADMGQLGVFPRYLPVMITAIARL